MAGEERVFRPIPKVISPQPEDIIKNPQLLADWIFRVALEVENIVQTDLTASNGVVLVGTDIQHADTSSISDVTLTAAQVLSTATYDGFGHALTLTTRNLTPADIGAEPAFAKNTAFNKNFGTSTGTVQQGDAGLGSIAGLTTAADTMIFTTAPDVYATTPLTAFARTFLDDTTAAAVSVTLELEIGVDVQAFDDGLESISGLTTVADRMIFTTASDTYAVTTLTSFARTLLDDADAGTARTTLGLGSMATQAANNVAITGGAINGTTVGASTAATGRFTTLTATGETFLNLPVVATGTSGSLWNDSGTVKVVP